MKRDTSRLFTVCFQKTRNKEESLQSPRQGGKKEKQVLYNTSGIPVASDFLIANIEN